MSTSIVSFPNLVTKYPKPAPTLWTPEEITSLLWLDADDAATLIEGAPDRLGQWNDKSASGYNVTNGATDSHRPLLNNATIGGKPTVSWTETQHQLSNLSVLFPTTTAYFAVVKARTHTGGGTAGLMWQNNRYWIGWKDDMDIMSMYGNGSAWNDPTFSKNTPIQSAEGPGIIAMLNDGVTATPWYDGTAQDTKSGITVPASQIYIGTNYTNADVGEILLVDSPDAALRQTIEGYLAHKWGVTAGLPGGHPYKDNAPTV